MAQRSAEGSEEWTEEQEGEAQETEVAQEVLKPAVIGVEGSYLPSQSMHSKGEQGNQTRSLPVSIKRETFWEELEPREREIM